MENKMNLQESIRNDLNKINETPLNNTNKEALIDSAIKQIVSDVSNRDYTAIAELLGFLPEKYLQGFLSDDLETADMENMSDETKQSIKSCLIKVANRYKEMDDNYQSSSDYWGDYDDIISFVDDFTALNKDDINQIGREIQRLDTIVRDDILDCIDKKYWEQLGFTPLN
jgi:hypothetical protein